MVPCAELLVITVHSLHVYIMRLQHQVMCYYTQWIVAQVAYIALIIFSMTLIYTRNRSPAGNRYAYQM